MGRGKTLWEMLMEWFQKPVEESVFNPLRAKVGSAVTISELDLGEYNFFVREIREYRRKIGMKNFYSVDYVLLARPLGQDDVHVRVRILPVDDPERAAGLSHHALLLRLDDELAYDEEFLAVVNDDTGKFQVLQDGNVEEEYYRVNDLRSPYQAWVTVVQDLDGDKKAEQDEIEKFPLEYWDYWRETKDEVGISFRQFLFVELNKNDGWIQIWKGQELDPQKVLMM